MKTKFILSALALVISAMPVLAQGNLNCQARDKIVERLQVRFDEQLMGRGLQGQIRLLEIFASTDGSSWTILQTHANGTSCVVASGTNWMENQLKLLPGVPG